jgi:hypothetical protein
LAIFGKAKCGKKIKLGDYGIFHYWGDYQGQEVTGLFCSLKCAMEDRRLHVESNMKRKF